jgi:hypothetical protein
MSIGILSSICKISFETFLDELLSISYQQTNLYKSLLNNQAKEHLALNQPQTKSTSFLNIP